MKRGVSIAAFSACGAAGLVVAALLAAAPRAGADEGTSSTSTTTTATDSTTTATTTTTTTTATTTTATTTTPPKPPQPKVIVAGVTVGGTLVGGLTAAEARAVVTERFNRPLRLVGGPGSRLVVTPRELGAVPDILGAVQLAARVKRPGFRVPLKVEVSRSRIDRLVASLAKRFQREPVDATLRLHNLKPIATREVQGRRLKPIVATRAIILALKTQQRGPLDLPFEMLEAPVRGDTLGHAIVIKRGSNELYYYRVGVKPKLVRQFKVATGLAQYPTPLGKFEVINKQANPWWYPPAGSDWAEGAKPIPPGSSNPLGTRWMGISSPYVGIHGTPNAASIGYSASHGCVRMLIPQVEWLFERVEVGTPVFIVAA